MSKNKNRKSFTIIMQAKGKKIRARIYRTRRNKHVSLGFIRLKKMPASVKERDALVVEFLREKGHVVASHVVGVDFELETV